MRLPLDLIRVYQFSSKGHMEIRHDERTHRKKGATNGTVLVCLLSDGPFIAPNFSSFDRVMKLPQARQLVI